MDKETYIALTQIVEAMQNDREQLHKIVLAVAEGFENRDGYINKLRAEVAELQKAVAELMLINGGSNADK